MMIYSKHNEKYMKIVNIQQLNEMTYFYNGKICIIILVFFAILCEK